MSAPADESLRAPFKGLRYFEEHDAHLFFGRDEQIDEVSTKLQTSRFVAVIGGSGCGKSSLVRAGLAHRLSAGLVVTGAGSRWRVVVMRPGSAPVENLAIALEKATSVSGLDTTLRRGPLGLVDVTRESGLQQGENLLVLVDQFEELFRFHRRGEARGEADQEATGFVKLLLEASQQKELPIHIVLTMRSDFLGNCSRFRDLPERINDGLYLVPRMSRDQMEQAIVGPIGVAEADIAPRLVQVLLNEVGDDPDELPVLQHTLLRTWNQWTSKGAPLRAIDLEDYEPVGPLQVSLSKHANEIYDRLTRSQQNLARVLFQRLIERDPENREIRHPASIEDMAQVAGDGSFEEIKYVIDRYRAPGAWFLIQDDQGMVDITHEALIRQWDKIQGDRDRKGWLQEEAEARDAYLEFAARARRARSEEDLLSGGDLERALRWQQGNHNEPWSLRYDPVAGGFGRTRRFIADSKGKQDRKRRKDKVVAGALATLAVVAVVAAVFGMNSAREAKENERQAKENERQAAEALARATKSEAQAKRSAEEAIKNEALAKMLGARSDLLTKDALARQLAAQSELLRIQRPHLLETSILLAIESLNRRYSGEASEALGSALALVRRPLTSTRLAKWINSISFSPRGALVAAITNNFSNKKEGFVSIWDLRLAGKPINKIVRPGVIRASAWSRDDKYFAVAFGQQIEIWPAAGSKPAKSFQTEERVAQITFSRKGNVLAAAGTGKGGKARIWRTTDWERIRTITHAPNVRLSDIALSADGESLVTAGMDGVALLWTLSSTSEKPVRKFEDHRSLKEVALSIDGRYLATASWGRVVRLWDVNSARELASLAHDDEIRVIAFSRDSRILASSSDDRTVRILDTTTRREYAPLVLGAAAHHLSFSPDGQLIATASPDLTVRIWDARRSTEVARLINASDTSSIDFSPSGKLLASGGYDGAVTIWHVAAPPIKAYHVAHRAAANFVDFTFDGKFFITASSTKGTSTEAAVDNVVKMWTLDHGRLHRRFTHETRVREVALVPGKPWLATRARDVARLWDVSNGKIMRKFSDIEQISPDGRFALLRQKNESRLIEMATGREVTTFKGSSSYARVIFSANGRYAGWTTGKIGVVIRTSDGTQIAKWDLGGKFDRIRSISPAGRHVVSGSTILKLGPNQEIRPVEGVVVPIVVAFSATGTHLAGAEKNGSIFLWNTDNWKMVAQFTHGSPILAIAFSEDERHIAAAGANGTARVWEVSTERELWRRQHDAPVKAIAFDRSGAYLGTASDDKTTWIGIWHPKELIRLGCAKLRRNLTPNEWHDYFGDAGYQKTCPTLPDTVEDKKRKGDLEVSRAIRRFRAAVATMFKNETQRDLTRAAARLIRTGRALAKEGNFEAARSAFAEALEIATRLDKPVVGSVDPERDAYTMAIEETLSSAISRVRKRQMQAAIDAYARFEERHPTARIPAYLWNQLCWEGALHGFARKAMDACDNAVRLAPASTKPLYHDSRGVARALTKNYAGALADFEAFLSWAKKANVGKKAWSKREHWIEELKAGRNPLNASALEELKKEEGPSIDGGES